MRSKPVSKGAYGKPWIEARTVSPSHVACMLLPAVLPLLLLPVFDVEVERMFDRVEAPLSFQLCARYGYGLSTEVVLGVPAA